MISSEGDVMSPDFFGKVLDMTKEVYHDVIKNVVKPWMVQEAARKLWLYQNDGTPGHTSNLVQAWCNESLDMVLSKEFWPPSSPDLNPCDCYHWGVLERESNKGAHSTADSLKTVIIQAVTSLSFSPTPPAGYGVVWRP